MDRCTHARVVLAASAMLLVSACTSKKRPPADDAKAAEVAATTGAATTGTTGADGTTTAAATPEEVALKVTPRPRTITTSGEHTCALTSGGEVACWGAGQLGQLGPGVDENRSAPVKVPEVRGAIQVVASKSASCALIDGGEIVCWGSRRASAAPERALWRTRKLGDVVELAMTRYSATLCGRRSDGTVACVDPFGDEASAVVSVVAGIDDALTIDTKSSQFCVLRGSRSLECWSSYKVRADQVLEAEVVATDVVDAAVSGSDHCYRTAVGGQLCGSYEAYKAVVPSQGPLWKTKIPGDQWADAVDYVSDLRIQCVRDRGGAVKCWGTDRYGQLGAGRFAYSDRPRPFFAGRKDVAGLAAGGTTSCVRLVEGDLECVEHRYSYGDAVQVAGIRALAIGDDHSCAVVGGEQLRCWGMNDDGCLGVPGDVEGLVRVPGLASVAHVAVGMSHTCAALRDHSVFCWGNGDAGQLGDGRYHDEDDDEDDGDGTDEAVLSTSPLKVTGVPGDVRDLALGDEFSCAATPEGIYCWGRLTDQAVTLEDELNPRPSRISKGDYTKIDAEGESLCALRADGGIECTGALAEVVSDLSERYDADAYDELEEEPEPFAFGGPLWTMVDFPGKAVDIAVGEDHACYLSDAGIVRCWGENKEGQLGDGTTKMRSDYVTVVDLKDVVEISAGDGHTCARERGGQVRCWGAWTGPQSAAKIDAPAAVVGLAPYVGVGDLDAPATAPPSAK